ncbi:ABC transporter ATP-binding protein [Candidatus Proelusimicrobium excrementi]|uniref:ABC transporter ATP-binding protein n=1 Tax=Candidatus Proelusimicrobium excrementi TaxID=3416222 RepID=UPI003CA8BEF5|nr:ABC transporter ATP-binding protein [Elusimicrobiaceae bacterium]
MIKIKDLKKYFGSKHILRGVNLDIKDGEVTTIIGGSGTGKSTLIKCIIRLLEPDGGEILVNGKDITHIKSAVELADLRRSFGYLFQEGALFDSLTVGENVTFGLKYLTDVPKADYAKIAKEKLALVGLKDIENLKPSELSGGMKKRVSLARVLATGPKVILYDEPTSGLDPIMSEIISELIVDLKHKLGVTSVVITHDMKSAFEISDTMAMLYEGKVKLAASAEEFRKTDNPYVKQFIEGSSKGPIQMQIRS